MRDQELEKILREIGREQFSPPPDLIHRTKQRLRTPRFLPVLLLVSLCMQLITVGCGIYVLVHPDIGWVAKTYGLFGFSILVSLFLLPLLGMGNQLRVCIERLRESYA
jgi:membrane associated rhomboid family serine protease